MRRVALLLSSLCLVAALPLAAGQGAHEHPVADGPRILIQSDIPPEGRALVGHPTHFEYLFLDKDDEPILHQDVSVKVELNGLTLYETHSAHDYDGVGGLDVVFPVPGDFTVRVDAADLTATYAGHAFPVVGAVPASLVLDAPTTVEAGGPATFTYSIVGADGMLLPHTDVRVLVRRLADDFPVLDVHTHSHEEAQAFEYAFEKAGEHEVRFVAYQAYPDKSAVVFEPFVTTHTVTVSGGGPVPWARLPVKAAPPADDPPSAPIHVPYNTLVQADPVSGQDGVTGPFSQVRTTMVTYNVTSDVLVQHLNYEAMLTGPGGLVFQSSSLHEYDGALTLMSANQAVGTYTWDLSVSRGDWGDRRISMYDVMPVSLPQGAGPQFLDVSGLDGIRSGIPADVGFFAHGPGVVPFMHSEIAFEVQAPSGLPLVAHKIHTHSDGRFAIGYTAPSEGAYALQADLFDIHGSPTPLYYGAAVGEPTRYAFEAAAGTPLPLGNTTLDDEPVVAPETVPAPALALAVALLAVVLIVLRRR